MRKLLAVTLASAGCIFVAVPASAKTQHADVVTFQNPDGTAAMGELAGSARIKRSKQDVLLSLETDQATPGDAYTVWWIIFNNPDACDLDNMPGCDGGDLGTPEVVASGLNAGGGVADDDGNFTITTVLPAGFMHTNTEGATRQLFGPGLQDTAGAELHVIVRSHGPANPNQDPNDDSIELIGQISTVEGSCGINACFDPFVAIFP